MATTVPVDSDHQSGDPDRHSGESDHHSAAKRQTGRLASGIGGRLGPESVVALPAELVVALDRNTQKYPSVGNPVLEEPQ